MSGGKLLSPDLGVSAATVADIGPDAPLRQLRGVFEEAQAAAGASVDFWLRLAGAQVRICFAGPALASRLTASLAHLASSPDNEPSLTIYVWDDTSTGVRTPCPPLPPGADANETGIFSYQLDNLEAAYEPSTSLLTGIDHTAGHGFLHVSSCDALSVRELASPFRMILSWWGARRGLQIAHASAVGTPHGGVLVVGRGGSGKSTTALACLGSHLGYTADDCCLVSDDEEPVVYGLYAAAKVERRCSSWFPRLEAAINDASDGGEGEAVLCLAETFADALVPSFPLRAVLVPSVRGSSDTVLEPCSQARALQALAPSTIFQFPGAGAATFGRLAAFIRRTDCYTLALGPDMSQVPDVIAGLLTESPSCAARHW